MQIYTARTVLNCWYCECKRILWVTGWQWEVHSICCKQKGITDSEVNGTEKMHKLLKIVWDIAFSAGCMSVQTISATNPCFYSVGAHTRSYLLPLTLVQAETNTWKHTMKLRSLFAALGPVHAMFLYALHRTHSWRAYSKVLCCNSQ